MLTLSRQSLADCRAELLVCGVSDDGEVKHGAIGALFQAAGGQLEECLKAGLGHGSRTPGSVVLTPAFGLTDRGVKALALVVVRPVPSLDELRQAMRMVAHHAREQKLKSLACPALGCGADALNPVQAAYAVLESLRPLLGEGVEIELALPRQADHQGFQSAARHLKLAL